MRKLSAKAKAVMRFLRGRRGVFYYGQVADALHSAPQAIGQIMKALRRRGYFDLCERVVSKRTGKPAWPAKS